MAIKIVACIYYLVGGIIACLRGFVSTFQLDVIDSFLAESLVSSLSGYYKKLHLPLQNGYNKEASYVNITLDGRMHPS
jgi:hypothetical protein